ncbi:origin recognition complex subunit 5, partial [Plasmodium cynomolgi strain B]
TFGFEREVQLHRLVNLLGDLRDPISVIQVLGLPGMGKTKVVKSFVKLKNVPFAYVNCLMALYQSGKSAKNVIYHTILKELSTNLLHEFEEYKSSNGFTNYSHDPTKLVPNHVSNTDVFFNVLHKLLSFRPEDGRGGGGDPSPGKKRRHGGKQQRQGGSGNTSEESTNGMTSTKHHLHKDKLYDRSVVIILDNVRYLVRTHPDLFYALTRIHEYIRGPYNDMTKANKTTRGLCIILINRSPLPDEIFDGLPQPPTVWFDSYTADMCKNILYRLYNTMCFESLLTYNDKDLKIYCVKENKTEFLIKRNNVILDNEVICDIWYRYVDYIINVSYKDYKSDFHELLFICAHMWPLFIKPILEGTLEPIVENMNALQRNIDTHIRVATYNHASHFTFELIDSVFLNENNLKNKIDLSFYSRVLLVGAYLASRNLPLTDKRFFNATVKGGAFTLPKKRKGRSKNESILTLIGQAIPKNFTFIRWICLTDCLLVCFFNEKLTLNSLICHQINTLIQLGFISFCCANNMSCLVRNSLMNGVQWSGYCGSALLNSTNNFSSLGNNIFSESANSVSYESLDPYTKLAIQVPEETIRSIARDLKIPLDELIL